MTYNDSFKASLEAKWYASSFTDAWNQYLQDNTDIESTVTPDMLAAWLSGKGFTGSVPDMLQQYAESTGYTSHAEQVIADAFLGCYQDVYSLDGVDDRGTLAFRAINPDGDIDIEFKTGSTLPTAGTSWTIVGQNITSTSASREFGLYTNNSNALQMMLGGSFSGNMGQPLEVNTTYRVTLVGTSLTFYKAGSVVLNTAFTRGAAREPTAVTTIGARNTSVSAWGSFYQGQIYDLKINGTLWPISERTQTIQLPSPSGLGAELITQSVLESPAIKGSQWTYLGGGRWQYVGDGSYNELVFIATNDQPQAGFFEFEVESITGSMRSYTSPSNVGSFQSNPVFTSTGRFRHFVTNRTSVAGGSYFTVVRNSAGVAASCIIKNISFKPLGTCNPLTLVNTTAERWSKQEVPCPVMMLTAPTNLHSSTNLKGV